MYCQASSPLPLTPRILSAPHRTSTLVGQVEFLSEKPCQDLSLARQQQVIELEPGAFAACSQLFARESRSRLQMHRDGGKCLICGPEFGRKPED